MAIQNSFNAFVSSKSASISSEITEYFVQQKVKSYWNEVYLPLWMKIYSGRTSENEQFIKERRITFTALQGFDAGFKKVARTPFDSYKTLEALIELSKRIMSDQNQEDDYSLIHCGVYVNLVKPVIQEAKENNYHNFIPLLKSINAFKALLKTLRDGTIIDAKAEFSLKPEGCTAVSTFIDSMYLSSQPFTPFEYPINQDVADLWVATHSDKFKKIAKKFVKNITYVSFDQFQNRLSASIQSFKKEIGQAPYIIVLPDNYEQKSNKWVTTLALKDLRESPPQEVVIQSDLKKYLDINPQNKNLVFFDDGAYSGHQMRNFISGIRYEIKGCLFYLIIPFMSLVARGRLAEKDTWFSEHQKLYSISDLFFEKDSERIVKSASEPYDDINPDSLTLTYFAHKVADSWSVHRALRSQKNLEGNVQKRLVAEITPPYKPML